MWVNTNKISNNEMIDSYKGEYYDLFKSIFDDAENGICIVDFNGMIVEMNNIYANMFGYQKEELINQHFSLLISEDSQPIVENNHYKIFNGTSILKAEEKVRHRDGTFFYVQTSNLRVNDEYGKKLRITTAIDVSSRLRNELVQSVLLKISNLTNLNGHFREIFKSVHEAVCQLLPLKNFAVCIKNKTTGKLDFPFKLQEGIEESESSLVSEYNCIEVAGEAIVFDEKSITTLIDTKQLRQYTQVPSSMLGIPLIAQNEILGSIVVKDYTGINYTNEDKELLELVAGHVSKVIERKNYENDLVLARNKAEDAVKIKSEFLAQISHEIRTPLNSILSFSSLIKNELDGSLTPELEESFNYIERGGNRLTRTIDLILNVSNSQNNQYKILLEEIDLNKDVLDPLIKELHETANLKGIKLILEPGKGTTRLVCDQYSVNQLFINLLENAIKYTEKGTVALSTYRNEVGKIQVDVVDTGIGIADEYIPNLFDPFSQEEQGYTRSYEGIGLGLALVKSYADLNNAEVSVKSKKDKGSVFSVVFN